MIFCSVSWRYTYVRFQNYGACRFKLAAGSRGISVFLVLDSPSSGSLVFDLHALITKEGDSDPAYGSGGDDKHMKLARN